MNISSMVTCFTGAAVALAISLSSTPATAAVLLYEPFNYSGSTGADITTLSGSATGLDATAYTGYGAATTYRTDGLSMGDLAVTGGRVSVPYQSSGYTGISRGLDFNLTAGSTLYGSFLFQQPGGSVSNSVGAVLFGSVGAIDTNADLNVSAHAYGAANITGIRTAAGGASSTGTTYGQGSENTVLVLFQATNMNAVSGSQQLSVWVLTADQFANFKSGGLTAAALNSASTGAAAANVLQRASYTNTGTYAALFDTDALRLFDYRYSGSYDEIRLSDTSLDQVTPLSVPEPATIALLGVGLALIASRRRR